MSIEPQQQQAKKVREDLNRYRLKQDGQDGQDGQDEGVIAGARENVMIFSCIAWV